MLLLKKNIEIRKDLVKRIEEMTGVKSFYTRAPLYAYEIGPYTVDRDGNLLVKESDADQNLLNELVESGMALPPETIGYTYVGEGVEADRSEIRTDAEDNTQDDVADADPETEMGILQDENHTDSLQQHTDFLHLSEGPDILPVSPSPKVQQPRRITVIHRTPSGEESQRTIVVPDPSSRGKSILDYSPEERAMILQNRRLHPDEPDEFFGEADVEASETAEETEGAEEESAGITDKLNLSTTETPESITEEEPLEIHLSFPIADHNGTTLKNLMHMLYTRGELLNKATRGSFDVNEDFIQKIDIEEPKDVAEFLKAAEEFKESHDDPYSGIELSEEQLTITGFPEGMALDWLDTCMKLAELINKTALNSRTVQAKREHVENERYTFRVWLLRLGMKGREYGMARKLLMRNLSGHTAFRTEADAKKAKLRADRLKAELAASKADPSEAKLSKAEHASESEVSEINADSADNAAGDATESTIEGRTENALAKSRETASSNQEAVV